jgi:hypothetical protein
MKVGVLFNVLLLVLLELALSQSTMTNTSSTTTTIFVHGITTTTILAKEIDATASANTPSSVFNLRLSKHMWRYNNNDGGSRLNR